MDKKAKTSGTRVKSPVRGRTLKSPPQTRRTAPPQRENPPKTKRSADESKVKKPSPRSAKSPTCQRPNGPVPHKNREARSPTRKREAGAHQTKRDCRTANAGTTPGARSPPAAKAERAGVKGQTAAVEKILLSVLDDLKIRKPAISESTNKVNDVVDGIIKHLKSHKSECFSQIEKLPTGSYYENVKISEPDEFDVMLTVPVQRVEIEQFDTTGAFYRVAFKRNPQRNPLQRFVLSGGTISASGMLNEFRSQVKQATETMPGVQLERKKRGSPAVTLAVNENRRVISVDIVLGLKVHMQSWPSCTKDGFNIDSWLGTKVKRDFKIAPFYLVPKYIGKGSDEKDGICAKDAWRISFSHVEKGILKNHGSAKTCCESGGLQCCRKQCLKLLKHLLQKLKEAHPKELSKFFSYQAKTTLLHACVKRPKDSDWEKGNLSTCFDLLLQDFIQYLDLGKLPHFFIPTYNLLDSGCDLKSMQSLIQYIRYEQNNMFPIFCERKSNRC
ncbi:CGAS synthase, partial [Atractosteus spatula]|nr:CGAS synthase [Atractosteus spatula]